MIHVIGWGPDHNGHLVNNNIINNSGDIIFEHGSFDNSGQVDNYSKIIADWKLNNSNLINNTGEIRLNPSATLSNLGKLVNNGSITMGCSVEITGNKIQNNTVDDKCIPPENFVPVLSFLTKFGEHGHRETGNLIYLHQLQ